MNRQKALEKSVFFVVVLIRFLEKKIALKKCVKTLDK